MSVNLTVTITLSLIFTSSRMSDASSPVSLLRLLPQAPSKSSQPSYTFTGYDMRKLAIEANQVYIKQKQAKQTKEKKQQPK